MRASTYHHLYGAHKMSLLGVSSGEGVRGLKSHHRITGRPTYFESILGEYTSQIQLSLLT